MRDRMALKSSAARGRATAPPFLRRAHEARCFAGTQFAQITSRFTGLYPQLGLIWN